MIDPHDGFSWLEVGTEAPGKNKEYTTSEKIKTQTEKAAYLIKDFLQHGDMPAQAIKDRLKEEGISRRMIDVVKNELGIISYRRMRKWYWSLETIGDETNEAKEQRQ